MIPPQTFQLIVASSTFLVFNQFAVKEHLDKNFLIDNFFSSKTSFLLLKGGLLENYFLKCALVNYKIQS